MSDPQKRLSQTTVAGKRGLWKSLTPDQRRSALAYRGPENLGEPPIVTAARAELRELHQQMLVLEGCIIKERAALVRERKKIEHIRALLALEAESEKCRNLKVVIVK